MTSPKREVLLAILKKADEKPEVARKDFEGNYFNDAASRAYYAAFHAISAALAKKGLSFSTNSQTLGAFNKEFLRKGLAAKELSAKLQRLFEDRQIGDYDTQSTIDLESAKRDIADAALILEVCRKLVTS